MNDEQLLRYSRHILLNEIGVEGQERISAAHALVIGAGGLGSPVALYLGSAGVGQHHAGRRRHVDLTNLQRQIAHTVQRVGQPKVTRRRRQLRRSIRDVRVHAIAAAADATHAGAAGCTGRRGARLQRQLRNPPGGQCRLRAPWQAPGVGRRNPF